MTPCAKQPAKHDQALDGSYQKLHEQFQTDFPVPLEDKRLIVSYVTSMLKAHGSTITDRNVSMTQLGGRPLLPAHMCGWDDREALRNILITTLVRYKDPHHDQLASVTPLLGGVMAETMKLMLLPIAFHKVFGPDATVDDGWVIVDTSWTKMMTNRGWKLRVYKGTGRSRQMNLGGRRSFTVWSDQNPLPRVGEKDVDDWKFQFELCFAMGERHQAGVFTARCNYACRLITRGIGKLLSVCDEFCHKPMEDVEEVQTAFETFIQNDRPKGAKRNQLDEHRYGIVFGCTSEQTLAWTGTNAQYTLPHLLCSVATDFKSRYHAGAAVKSIEQARSDGVNVATRLDTDVLTETLALTGASANTVDDMTSTVIVPIPSAGTCTQRQVDKDDTPTATLSENATLSGSLHVDLNAPGLPEDYHPLVVTVLNTSQCAQPSPRYGMFHFVGCPQARPYRCVAGTSLPIDPTSRQTLALNDVQPMCFTIILGEMLHCGSPRLS